MGRIFSVILLLLLSVNVLGQTLYESFIGDQNISMVCDNPPCVFAQTFTIGTTGTNESFVLDSVLVSQYTSTAVDDITVSIYETSGGLPTGTAISSVEIHRHGVLLYIDLPNVILYSSTMYALVIDFASSVNTVSVYNISEYNQYTGGNLYYYNGLNWIIQDDFDQKFGIYGHRNPTITTHPVSQTKCVGQSVTFTVASDAVSPTYQWKKNGSNISGQTSSSYTISSVASSDAANYTCTVTESALGVSTTSNAATLTVPTTTSITSHPSSISRCAGLSATFSVTAVGTSLTYQWNKNGSNISGATSTSYTISSVATGDAANYTVTVTGTCGTVTSNTATLTVNTLPSISVHPVSQSKELGESVTFSVTASGSGLTYQWRKGEVNISGATSSSYTITGVEASDVGSYDVVITNECGVTTSSDATLTLTNCIDSLLVDLVGYWSFEETNGTNVSVVSEVNNVTLNSLITSSTMGQTGKIDNCFTYAVGNDYVASADVSLLQMGTSDCAISAWIYPTTLTNAEGGYGFPICGGTTGSMILYVQSTTGKLVFGSSSVSSVTSDLVVSINEWHHVAASYDQTANEVTIWLDGNSQVLSFSTTFTAGTYLIGQSAFSTSNEFVGKIDELGIWKRKLTTEEILALYNSDIALPYPFCLTPEPPTPSVRKKILLSGKLRNIVLNNIERDFGEGSVDSPSDYPDWTPDVLSGKVLYVDISGSSSNDGLTESTPVTIADVESKIDNTFDFIAISDTTHYGTITIDNVDRSYGDPLKLTTWVKYNSGHKAQIKGLSEITGWKQSGNFWYKSGISGLPLLRNDIYNEPGMDGDVYMKSHMNGVYINNTYYEISKYPDDKTYYSIESTDGSSYVRDNDGGVPIADYWNGATMASEVRSWVNSKYTVTDYNSDGTYYINNIYASVYPVATMKYFLLNHKNAANNNGEWVIDHATNRVDIYYDSDLNSQKVFLPTVDYTLKLLGTSYIEVRNLSFYGANKIQVHNFQTLGTSVRYCDFNHAPYAAIGFYNCDSNYVQSNNIFYSGDNGIVSMRSNYNYFSDNYIKGCGVTGTFGGDRDGEHLHGISCNNNYGDYGDSYIYRNIIDSTGHNGICVGRQKNVIIENNYVNAAMQLVSDGAGIYASWHPDAVQKYIRNNLVTNTFDNIGYNRNGQSESRAIYTDEGFSEDPSETYNRMWLIDSNVVYKYSLGFFQNRETRKIHWRNNILADRHFYVSQRGYAYNYNTDAASGLNADSSFFTKNIVVAGSNDGNFFVYFSPDATIIEYENLIDSNRYINPFADEGIIWLTSSGSPSYTRTLRDTIWVRANSTFEDNTTYNDLNWGYSDVSGITEEEMIWCFANWSSTEHIFDLGDAVFKDVRTGSNVSGTLTLQPYKANVYLYVSGVLSGVDSPIYEDRIP